MSYKINNIEVPDIKHLEGQRITTSTQLTTGKNFVYLKESMNCCGKLYLFDFAIYDPTTLKDLFAQCLEVTKMAGYSAVGLLHHKKNPAVETSKEFGFKEVVTFLNKRSGNTLTEMILIL